MMLYILFISTLFLVVHSCPPRPSPQPQNDDFPNVAKGRAFIFGVVREGVNYTLLGLIDIQQSGPAVVVGDTSYLFLLKSCRLSGLPPGLHGFHVHEYGDLGDGCNAAGLHYNPFMMEHGGPDSAVRHLGDLGNIYTQSDGMTTVSITDTKVTLNGRYSVIGRAFVIHAQRDDLGLGTAPTSKTTGDSGSRIACGVIGIAQ
ncbi:copper/zinc superoxide dismutase [Dictyocaulus viviparus]|uniref:Superoxide dismutase [Cu-Zn] n=1 Tax=Dictyocaulus viviparus TaxID=29172 RepID=A0A0D8XRV3_DICVI|nr:copper/zinc superoxide dismutase [Dictyocaulus viviparus]